ncbi:uncharacterized protein LOC106476781, partial [Limulus polyphemus]|uniref:Uncharacterized protein LOC106476781 n=1 Tax=Limulus polyphemus TaxID=6850 RepID=A0ABM1C233_LIMPO
IPCSQDSPVSISPQLASGHFLYPYAHDKSCMQDELPPREPVLSAMPKKSALKKRSTNSTVSASCTKTPSSLMSVSFTSVISSASSLVSPLSTQNRIKVAKFPPAMKFPFTSDNKENQPIPMLSFSGIGFKYNLGIDENLLYWRDYYGDDEEGRLAAKVARKDSLEIKLSQRPDRQELINKNIIHSQTEQERLDVWEAVGNHLTR